MIMVSNCVSVELSLLVERKNQLEYLDSLSVFPGMVFIAENNFRMYIFSTEDAMKTIARERERGRQKKMSVNSWEKPGIPYPKTWLIYTNHIKIVPHHPPQQWINFTAKLHTNTFSKTQKSHTNSPKIQCYSHLVYDTSVFTQQAHLKITDSTIWRFKNKRKVLQMFKQENSLFSHRRKS